MSHVSNNVEKLLNFISCLEKLLNPTKAKYVNFLMGFGNLIPRVSLLSSPGVREGMERGETLETRLGLG